MAPLMILQAVGVVTEFVQVLLSDWSIGILGFPLLHLYFLFCIYSLYDKIKMSRVWLTTLKIETFSIQIVSDLKNQKILIVKALMWSFTIDVCK